MHSKHPALELIVGEQYQYRGHVFDVVSNSDGNVELANTTQRGDVRLQTVDRLQQAANRGDFVRVREAPFAGRQHRIIAGLDERSRAALARCTAYVYASRERFGSRLPRAGTVALIKEVAEQLGDRKAPCYNTLRNWMKRYLASNECACALIPMKKMHLDQWERLPEIIRDTIDECLHKYYYIREPECVSDIVGAIQASLETQNASRPLTDKIIIPSASTLRRRIREQGEYRRLVTQKGYAAAAKALTWSVRTRPAYRLLERIEGDTHTLDVELVNEQGKTIGKAALTVLIDVASRKIIGWDISINPASAQKSMRALKPSIKNYGVGEEYRLDNGPENTDRDELDTAFSFLGPHITYCKVRQPNEKPYVERWFKTVTTGLTHALRGTTFSNPEERGDYPSEEEAIYTLPLVKSRFADWLENVYHKRHHRGIRTSPNAMWEVLAAEQPPLRRIGPQDMARIFLSKTTSTITNGRVRYKNLQWTCAELHQLHAMGTRNQRLDVFYDKSSLGEVIVCHPDHPHKTFTAKAVDPLYQEGLTLDLHLLLNAQVLASGKAFNFRDARDHKIRLMQHRYAFEHKRGRRKAAQTDEVVQQAHTAKVAARQLPPTKNVLPTEDLARFFNISPTPSIGDVSEKT